MSDSYSGDKILARQRVCAKCRSFVTLERINEKQFSCPLCGQRLNAYVDLQGKISYREIADLVRSQHEAARVKRSS
jgi:transcription initiation factor IIE alpha subunit